MRKLVESTFVSLDGVISSPEKWGPPYWDEDHDAYAQKLLFAAGALLLGRQTYEGFAQAWPTRSGDPYTDRINAMPKYVASTTLNDPLEWNANLIKGDVAAEVAKLKQEPGLDILKFGTGELTKTLMKHDLIDEFHYWLFPVVVGEGDRLLERLEMTHLDFVGTTTFKSGIIVLKYAPKGDTSATVVDAARTTSELSAS